MTEDRIATLEGYERIVKDMQERGFTTYMSVKDFLQTHNDQLTKAKELLKQWVELFKPKGGNIPPTPIQVDTEQFLKEIEK